jgi:hypothetical protein
MRQSAEEKARSGALPLFLLAFAWGLSQIYFPSTFGFGPGWETVAIARELARTGAFANPFQAGPSGATAVIAPLFPAYLAALIKLLGDTPIFAFAAILAAVLAQALHAALLPRVSMLFFGKARPGILAGLLSVFAFRLMPQWDAAFTSCCLLLFLLNASAATWLASAFSGAAAGLLLLVNPATVLITGPWMAFLCWRRKVSLARVGGFGAAAFLVALPWMLRNDSTLGTFSVKDNFGMTAYASNNDCAKSSLAASSASGCYDAMHPNSSAQELRILNRLGEARYDKVRMGDTVRWVRSHPDAFARLTVERMLDFWFPPAAVPLYATFTIWVATGLAFQGLILLMYRGVPASLFMIVVAAVYPLLYYVVVSDVRYRYPLLWLSLLCAGYLLSELANHLVPILSWLLHFRTTMLPPYRKTR